MLNRKLFFHGPVSTFIYRSNGHILIYANVLHRIPYSQTVNNDSKHRLSLTYLEPRFYPFGLPRGSLPSSKAHFDLNGLNRNRFDARLNLNRCFSSRSYNKDEIIQLGGKLLSVRTVLKVPIVLVKWSLIIPFKVCRCFFNAISVCLKTLDKLARFAARAAVVEKTSGVSGIFKSIIGGIKHTIHWCKTGSKLYAANVKVSYYILKKWIRGHPVRYNERKLLMKTLNDALKLVPFSFFIIVPFAEFLLPVVLRFFPQMLPSTFQTPNKDDDYLQKKLKAKKELAQFFQELVQERTNQILQEELDSSLRTKAEALKQFQERLLSKKDLDVNPFLSANELLVFSKLFKKEFVLEKMSLETLKVMCKLLGITPFAMRMHVVLQLRHHLLKIQREDRLIMWEGVESLTMEELQEACKERAMKFYNVTKEQMQQQLQQWLDLSSRREIPLILLLWSRCITMTHEPMFIKDTDPAIEDGAHTDSYIHAYSGADSADPKHGDYDEKIKKGIKNVAGKNKVVQDVVEAAEVDVGHLQDRVERLEELSQKAKELKDIIEGNIKEEEIIPSFENIKDVPTKEQFIQNPEILTDGFDSSAHTSTTKKLGLLNKDELVTRHQELLSALDVQMQISDLQYDQLTELFSYLVKISETANVGDQVLVKYEDLKPLLDSTRREFLKIEELSHKFQQISQNLD